MAAAEAVALLEALRDQVAAVTHHGLGLLRRVRAGGLCTSQGVSLLEVRGQALLQYLQDLGLVLGAKARGGSLGALPALPRLLETRLVLEKLRPAERRLRHQLDRLLRGTDDALRFRPRPAHLADTDDITDDVTNDDVTPSSIKAPGLGGGRRYVPPRLVPVQYEEEEPLQRERRREEARRRRALSTSLIRELKEELGEEPVEEKGGAYDVIGAPMRSSARERYEEAMLLRLRESREERARRRQRHRHPGDLAGIASFGEHVGELLLGTANQEAPPPKKKKKAGLKKKAANGKRRRWRRATRRR